MQRANNELREELERARHDASSRTDGFNDLRIKAFDEVNRKASESAEIKSEIIGANAREDALTRQIRIQKRIHEKQDGKLQETNDRVLADRHVKPCKPIVDILDKEMDTENHNREVGTNTGNHTCEIGTQAV